MSKTPRTLLVVDDDDLFGDVVARHFTLEGFDVATARTCAEALAISARRRIDAVLLDQELPDCEGQCMCPRFLEHNEEVKIIFITAFPSFENAVHAVRAGAFDYLSKPVDLAELELVVSKALRTLELENVAALREYETARVARDSALVGRDSGLAAVWEQLCVAASADAPVLITGETGTGKNVVARQIHATGPKRNAPFVAINCAALPENLMESELFGHEKGAFTGAVVARKGIFEMAEGGTLLLDEIGEMSPHVQAKLLGVLDTGEIRRLGGESIRRVDVRIIAATSVEAERAVAEGRFRKDLFYRLSVIRIHLPPLRERRQDIAALCRHVLDVISRGRRVLLRDEEIARLARYDWPGNVRELRNVLERAMLLGPHPEIRPSELLGPTAPARTAAGPGETGRAAADEVGGTEEPVVTLAELQRRHVERVLRRHGGNRTRSALALGISLSTLKRMLRSNEPA